MYWYFGPNRILLMTTMNNCLNMEGSTTDMDKLRYPQMSMPIPIDPSKIGQI